MKISDAVRQRRSIRRYSDKVPADVDIEKILEAGTWAPSGLNNQPWKFKVVKASQQKEKLAQYTKYAEIIKSAPVVVCVFLDNSATYNREKDIMAVGACIQNMLLEAYARGLGTCWLGEILNRKEKVQDYLDIHPDYELMAVISVGYPEEGPTKGCRKNVRSFLIQ